MRHALVLVLCLMSASCWADDIALVLQRSQQLRGAAWVDAPAASARAAAVRRSFDTLTQALGLESRVRLRVVVAPIVAETLLGHVVVANEAVGDLPEPERLFILAHELGHVVGGHWSQMGTLYQRFVPGEVTRDRTDAVADVLSESASRLAHQQEYEADTFAWTTLRALGAHRDEVIPVFTRFGLQGTTATHPATRSRVNALQAYEVDH